MTPEERKAKLAYYDFVTGSAGGRMPSDLPSVILQHIINAENDAYEKAALIVNADAAEEIRKLKHDGKPREPTIVHEVSIYFDEGVISEGKVYYPTHSRKLN